VKEEIAGISRYLLMIWNWRICLS